MTVRTALELASNYPENIKIESRESTDGKYSGFLHVLRDGSIHKLLLSTEAVFETSDEAEKALHEICDWAVKEYNT